MIASFSIHRPCVQRIRRRILLRVRALGDVCAMECVAEVSIQLLVIHERMFLCLNKLTGHGLELELERVLGWVACDIHISCALCGNKLHRSIYYCRASGPVPAPVRGVMAQGVRDRVSREWA